MWTIGLILLHGTGTLSCGGKSSVTSLSDAGHGPGGGTSGGHGGSETGGSGGNTPGGSGGSETGSGGTGGATGGSSGTGGGSSSACRSDAECASSGQICDAVAGECVDCLFDSACGEGRQCRKRTCVDSVACSSSLECAVNEVCDQSRGVCEECVDDDDCGTSGECTGHVCSYFVRCTSSLDCPQGQVCDSPRGRCAECASFLDCKSDQTCHNGSCTTRCISDKDCVAYGKLCDKTSSACVACLQHSHCPEAFHCKNGECVLDVCETGVEACDEQTIIECAPAGDSMQSIGACSGQTTCRAIAGDAECAPWACTAGQTYCQNDHVIKCSADGLAVLSDRDCTTEGMKCFSGECKAQVCYPNANFCYGGHIQRCSADGLSYSLAGECWPNQYCDAALVSCEEHVCPPNAPACNGNVATTCNAAGTGYLAGGTNCSNTSTTCSMGACINCSDQRIAADGVRLMALQPHYWAMHLMNKGGCTITGHNLHIQVTSRSSSTGFVYTDYNTCYSDLAVGDTFYFNPRMDSSTTGSNLALLCYQNCNSVDRIIDVVQLGNDLPPPAGVTFMSPLTNVGGWSKYLRIGYQGVYPDFFASDWMLWTP